MLNGAKRVTYYLLETLNIILGPCNCTYQSDGWISHCMPQGAACKVVNKRYHQTLLYQGPM